MSKKSKKVAILGAGNVGATIAYTLTVAGTAGEIVLVDINREKARGEAMDIIQGTAFCPPVNIYAGDYDDAAGADIVIVTVGLPRKTGQSRIDLAQVNVEIIKSVMDKVIVYAPDAIYLIVSNPVDILTYAVIKHTGLPQRQVFGSGTMLDTARLRTIIADYVDISPKNIHGFVLGEHGDSSVVPWSTINVGGMTLSEYHRQISVDRRFGKAEKTSIENDVRTAGSKIIAGKGATYYAVALTVKRIVECILRDTRSVLTVSSIINGEYGINDVALSLPYVIGRNGLERGLMPPLNKDETAQLRKSAETLQKIIASLKI